MKDNDFAIKLEGISKKYKLYANKRMRMREALRPGSKKYHKEFYALRDINLEIKKGEILGIVGRNGSGKSTLLKIISGILQPSTGNVQVKGKVVPLLELGGGFNPEYSGLENIYFYNSILGYSRAETKKILDKVIDFAEIGDFINQPLKTYSSGMKARLSFAVSVNIDPDILVVDEVLAVGDELFRRKSYAKMEEFFKAGKTILFVSHSANTINELCSKAILLHNGSLIYQGTANETTKYYQKLLFSKKNDPKSVLNEIKNDNSNNTEKETAPTVKTSGSYFLENFKPKSTVDVNNSNVRIQNIKMLNEDGKSVNCLMEGEEYTYQYEFSSPIKLKQVSLGFRIKSEKGLHISGISLQTGNDLIEIIEPNRVYTVSYKFYCNLRPGIYFTNQGISSVEGEKVFFHRRIVDAFVFKVFETENRGYSGMVSLGQRIMVK